MEPQRKPHEVRRRIHYQFFLPNLDQFPLERSRPDEMTASAPSTE